MVSEQEDSEPQPQPPDAGRSTAERGGWPFSAGATIGMLFALFVGGVAGCLILTDITSPICGEETTRAKLKTIDLALDDYNKRHHEYPVSLRVLTERQDDLPAYLDGDTIRDEWGNEFIYEPDKHSPKNGRPWVWSRGKDSNDPRDVISNW